MECNGKTHWRDFKAADTYGDFVRLFRLPSSLFHLRLHGCVHLWRILYCFLPLTRLT